MAKAPAQSAAPNVPQWMVLLKKYRGLIVPISFVLLLGVVLVPLPPMVLDFLLASTSRSRWSSS